VSRKSAEDRKETANGKLPIITIKKLILPIASFGVTESNERLHGKTTQVAAKKSLNIEIK
jgi:hypothetical protein